MPKKFLKRWMPDPAKIKAQKNLRMFGRWLGDGNLWHLNRRSASGAFAVGLFMAWIPVPFQMALAAGAAILLRVNLPLSVAMVWLTNPVTMPPMFYFAYYFGARVLGMPPVDFEFNLSWEWLVTVMETIGKPFLLGCGMLAVICSLVGYLSIQLLWRISVQRRWAQRLKKDGSR